MPTNLPQMRQTLPATALVVTLFVTAAAVTQEHVTHPFDHWQDKPGFVLTQQDDIAFLSDLDAQRVTLAIHEISTTRARINQLIDQLGLNDIATPPNTLHVIGFRHVNDLRKAANLIQTRSSALGLYHRPSGVVLYLSPPITEQFREQMYNIGATLLRHETTHQILDQRCQRIARRMPVWLAEGLACYFESNKSVNNARADDIAPTLAAGNFVKTIHDLWSPDAPANLTAEQYAIAWATTNHALHNAPEKLGRYLRALHERPPADFRKHFEETVMTIDESLAHTILTDIRRLACDPPKGE